MVVCSICGYVIAAGTRTVYHNNAPCHFSCLPPNERPPTEEELKRLLEETPEEKLEVLRRMQEADIGRTPAEKKEDKEDREEMRKLMEVRGQQKAAIEKRNAEQKRIQEELEAKRISEEEARKREQETRASFLKEKVNLFGKIQEADIPRTPKEIEEDREDLEEVRKQVAPPKKSLINDVLLSLTHIGEKHQPRDISSAKPLSSPSLEVLKHGPLLKPQRPAEAISIQKFTGKCPYCGYPLKLISTSNEESEYECTNSACG